VVGSPDSLRGEIVKAFVILSENEEPLDDTVRELQEFVKSQLAPYKYPRGVEFMEELPLTPTGKIQRGALRKLEKDRAAGLSR
jgi:acyl-coenzyme A synthetase/AMP-(fatty) acid ligase